MTCLPYQAVDELRRLVVTLSCHGTETTAERGSQRTEEDTEFSGYMKYYDSQRNEADLACLVALRPVALGPHPSTSLKAICTALLRRC